jgi:histidinol-phosphatase (PHP family)
LEIGFTAIGFSGHSHTDYITSSSSMTVENTRLYKEEIARLKKKYEGRIEIFCGLEFDQYSDDDRQGYEYIIGTNHYLKMNGKYIGFDRSADVVRQVIDEHFAGDGLKFAKEYYRELAELPKYGDFDIVGHFDLISKNCEIANLFDETDERYQKYALDCFYALKEKIPVFEVNTGAMARGYRKTPYPRPFLLKEMAKTGVGIVLGSDCHDSRYLTYGFDEAVALCKACGVKELQIFTKGEFKGVPLE